MQRTDPVMGRERRTGVARPLGALPRLAQPDATADTVADAELKDRLRSGDPTALEDLLATYWRPLVGYVTALTDQPSQAEDLAQEAFVRLWEQRREWSAPGSLRTLLYRIARNLAFNHRRWLRVRLRARVQLALVQRTERRTPTPLETIEQAELRAALEHALAGLSPRRREIFTLRQIHGLSLLETAETLGITVQSVKNQMGAAVADLRRLLGPMLE